MLKDIFGNQYTFDQCGSCGVYFLNPQPSQEKLSKTYDGGYYGVGEKKFNPLVEGVLDWFRKRRAQSMAGVVPPHAKVLDIGCGSGNFLDYLGRLGDFELHGVEPEGK